MQNSANNEYQTKDIKPEEGKGQKPNAEPTPAKAQSNQTSNGGNTGSSGSSNKP